MLMWALGMSRGTHTPTMQLEGMLCNTTFFALNYKGGLRCRCRLEWSNTYAHQSLTQTSMKPTHAPEDSSQWLLLDPVSSLS